MAAGGEAGADAPHSTTRLLLPPFSPHLPRRRLAGRPARCVCCFSLLCSGCLRPSPLRACARTRAVQGMRTEGRRAGGRRRIMRYSTSSARSRLPRVCASASCLRTLLRGSQPAQARARRSTRGSTSRPARPSTSSTRPTARRACSSSAARRPSPLVCPALTMRARQPGQEPGREGHRGPLRAPRRRRHDPPQRREPQALRLLLQERRAEVARHRLLLPALPARRRRACRAPRASRPAQH
jgi:hypothetical protein